MLHGVGDEDGLEEVLLLVLLLQLVDLHLADLEQLVVELGRLLHVALHLLLLLLHRSPQRLHKLLVSSNHLNCASIVLTKAVHL